MTDDVMARLYRNDCLQVAEIYKAEMNGSDRRGTDAHRCCYLNFTALIVPH